MIREFTKANVKEVHASVRREVDAALAKFGLKLGKSTGRYDASEFKINLSVTLTEDISGKFFDKLSADFEKYAPSYGLPISMFGKDVVVNGKLYQIVGWNNRSNKYKVLIQNKFGKRLKTTVDSIVRNNKVS